MAKQTMPLSKKHKIPSPFQPPPFNSIPLYSEQHDESLGAGQNNIGNGSPPQNDDSACTKKMVHRLWCSTQLPLAKAEDICKKSEVIKLTVICNNKTAVIKATYSSDHDPKERAIYRNFHRRMNATTIIRS